MPPEAYQRHYHDNIAIGMPPGHTPQMSRIRIRRTNLYRIASFTDATVSHLNPGADEVFLFSSLRAPAAVRVGGATASVPALSLVLVEEPRMRLLTPRDTDLILAVTPGPVVRALDLHVAARVGGIVQVRMNPLLVTSLELALMRAFDAVDASRGYLDPRVLDVLHMMSRSIIQLPADVDTGRPATVSPLERARALIAETHVDPLITPETIAEALGIPLRTLQRAFSAEHSSLSRELRRARAGAAGALLASPAAARYSAKRTARESGFSSVASMRRALVEFASGDEPDNRPP